MHLNGSEFVFFDAVKDNRTLSVSTDYVEHILTLSDSEIMEHLSKFQGTLRIHNVHAINPQLQNCLLEEFFQNQRTFTCNLYFSASQKHRGADFHLDQQNTYVYHILGMKKWFFGNHSEHKIENANEASTIVLMPRQTLYIPLGVAHRAEAVEGCSVHLSFAENIITSREITFALMNEWVKFLGPFTVLDETNPDQIRQQLEEVLKGVDLPKFVHEFINETKLKRLRFVKNGRDRRQFI